MKLACKRESVRYDIETNKMVLVFKLGKVYDATDKKGRIEVTNEEGSRHVIKTPTALKQFFDSYFEVKEEQK